MDVKIAGALGGKATLERKGKQHFIRIGKIGREAKKRNRKLNIGT